MLKHIILKKPYHISDLVHASPYIEMVDETGFIASWTSLLTLLSIFCVFSWFNRMILRMERLKRPAFFIPAEDKTGETNKLVEIPLPSCGIVSRWVLCRI